MLAPGGISARINKDVDEMAWRKYFRGVGESGENGGAATKWRSESKTAGVAWRIGEAASSGGEMRQSSGVSAGNTGAGVGESEAAWAKSEEMSEIERMKSSGQ